MKIICPKCGDENLLACSSAGNGIAACDACCTYWQKGQYVVPEVSGEFPTFYAAILAAETVGAPEVHFCPNPWMEGEYENSIPFQTKRTILSIIKIPTDNSTRVGVGQRFLMLLDDGSVFTRTQTGDRPLEYREGQVVAWSHRDLVKPDLTWREPLPWEQDLIHTAKK